MERFTVAGGARLEGEVRVAGAKNSVLKLMAAALLAPGRTVIRNVPDILDVSLMTELLVRLGCAVEHSRERAEITAEVPERPDHRADYDLVRRMRASINVLGPLVARCGEAEVALPGGDAIGSRPLDFHVAGLVRMGATVETEHGFIMARAPGGLRGAMIYLDFPSVGATENLLTAAVLAKGTSVIDNAAREPEIVDLCRLLQSMGAVIDGVGTATLEVTGVDGLSPADHVTVPDRMVAGTWAIAAAMTQGDVTVTDARPEHLDLPLDKLTLAGAEVTRDRETFRVVMNGRPRAVDVVTLPYPGFPTDLQPMVLALNAVAEGMAMVTENVYEARFMFVNELIRLGADLRTDGHHAVVRGRERLSAAPVQATDIRAGAGLVLAALCADGVTTIDHAYHVDRGYPGFVEDIVRLGGDVRREHVESDPIEA